MNTYYLNFSKCLCIVIMLLSGLNITIAQPGFTANDQVIPDSGPFIFGTNMGYYPGWTDSQLGDLAAGNPALNLPGIGANALRPGLFEYFTADYGNPINLPAFQHYQDLGMKDHTLFIGYASDAHRDPNFNCPNHYEQTRVFKNMYEPIWDGGANGTPVNDENYYALWLYELIQIYGPYVKYWEIWNEPDLDFSNTGRGWRPPGDAAGNWWDADPEVCDIQWGAPIEYYNRLMRISWEVIKTYDPGSYVTVGGLGYPSFLDAMMRNTDNPVDGSVTAEYPLLGGAYFDVLSFHSYPHINGSLRMWDPATNSLINVRNSDRASNGIIEDKEDFEAVLQQYGYGTTFPKKEVIMTESNIPRKKIGDYIGSEMAQVNYLLKLPVHLQQVGVNQFYVYDLGEKLSYDDAWHPFHVTGLYEDPVGSTFSSVVRTNGGIAYKTGSDQLFGKTYDEAKTNEMLLPEGVDGAAFKDANNNYTYVLWAITTLDDSEDASATYSFPSSFGLSNLEKIEWDHSETGQKSFITDQNISLNGTPIFLSETDQSFTVTCSSDINVEEENDQGTVVSWNPPAASTSCPSGNISITQTSGQTSGSSFQVGSHTITYSISDDCGNSQNCSFTIVVTTPPPPPVGCGNGEYELNIEVTGYGSVEVQYINPSGSSDICNSTCTFCVASGTLIKLVPVPESGEYFLGWTDGGCSGNGDCWKTISWETNITAQFTTNGPPPVNPPTISATTDDVSCLGESSGNVFTTVVGGTPDYTYAWNNGQTSKDLNNIPAGTYTVTVTDANAQTASISKTVNEPTQLVGQIISQSDVSCSGGADGSATASAVGGTPPYSYLWSGGTGDATASALAAGSYTVTIYDANACSTTMDVDIAGNTGTVPSANFSSNANATTIDFTDLSTGDVSEWTWDFGDGNSSNNASPSHTFANAGSSNVCLTVSNACGENTFCQNISVGQTNDIVISMGTNSANSGEIVQIQLLVKGFENIVSFQHAISIVDTSKAEFVGLTSFDNAITTLNPPTTNVDPAYVSVVWVSNSSPITIVDGATLYIMDVLVKGDPNECVDIVIDDTIVPTEFVMLENGTVVQVPFDINDSQICASPGAIVDGFTKREDGLPIEYVEVYNGGNMEAMTSSTGNYQLPPYTLGTDIVIEPHKDINYVNGVTSFDLAVIQQHIVGNALLTSPYKLIASDINNSGAISAYDLYLAQEVIVGNDSIFPNNESWRFVPESFEFVDETDPWANGGFPESIVLNSVTGSMTNQNFIAIKVGDVTDSAIPNDTFGNVPMSETRSSTGGIEFFMNKKINADGTGYVDILAKDFSKMSAFQFDLSFMKNEIELLEVESQAIDVLFGNRLLEEGIATLVWYDKTGSKKGRSIADEAILFRLHFDGIALTTHLLDDLIEITEATTLPNAYTSDGSPKEIYLKPFVSETPSHHVIFDGIKLQNRPNPFTEKTTILFNLPIEEQVQISIFDVNGKVVHEVNANFPQGKNEIAISSDDLPHSGVYYFRLRTSSADVVQKMIYLK